MLKATVIGYTIDANVGEPAETTADLLNDLKIFAGKNAGICYMKDQYFDSDVSNPEKAFERFNKISCIGHHSIADHCKITILFENSTKYMAMMLNSLQDYTTSEKSGRYTDMSNCKLIFSERNLGNLSNALYTKWKHILSEIIKNEFPDMDENQATKYAQENARYFLSIFARTTTFSYTTSLRQFNYIINWCESIIEYLDDKIERVDASIFTNASIMVFRELLEALNYCNIFTDSLSDPKERVFQFNPCQSGALTPFIDKPKDSLKEMYTTFYEVSLASLAQLQRHRTLKYQMELRGNETKFYVPPIILGSKYADEWLNDMRSIKEIIPQGTLVQVCERGYIEDFLMKAEERLCGRAQLETMQCVHNVMMKFINSGELNEITLAYIKDVYMTINEDTTCLSPCTKGELNGCKEPCYFGCKNAFTRKI